MKYISQCSAKLILCIRSVWRNLY